MSSLSPRAAVLLVFIAFGSGIGLWAGSIPTVTARSGIIAEVLGCGITAMIASVMLGMVLMGVLARRVNLKTLLIGVQIATAMVLALLLQAAGFWQFLILFALIGATGGALDALMNAEGVAVEGDLGKPVLAGFHAYASLGAAVCAIIGSYVSVNFGTHFTAVLTSACYLVAIAATIIATPVRPLPQQQQAKRAGGIAGLALPIVLLALVYGLVNGGETMAALFSASFLAFQAPDLAAYAGAGTTAFGFCQFFIRVFADRLRQTISDLHLIEASVVVGAAGCALVATSGSFAQSVSGFGLIGIGSACISPCVFALAPKLTGLAASQAIGLLAMLSSITRVPAPLGFGAIVDRAGYPIAFAAAAGLFALALFLTMVLIRKASRLEAKA
jgi:MFS family permease